MSLNYLSQENEEIYGMGLQYTDWNLKGREVPLISVEPGVGRGSEPLSTAVNNSAPKTQGAQNLSYSPAAQYITNKRRAFVFENQSTGNASFGQD